MRELPHELTRQNSLITALQIENRSAVDGVEARDEELRLCDAHAAVQGGAERLKPQSENSATIRITCPLTPS